MRRLAEKHFGAIPRGPEPPRNRVDEPPQTATRSETMTIEVQVPVVVGGYHIPRAADPDTAPLEVLASILSGGESSRLHRAAGAQGPPGDRRGRPDREHGVSGAVHRLRGLPARPRSGQGQGGAARRGRGACAPSAGHAARARRRPRTSWPPATSSGCRPSTASRRSWASTGTCTATGASSSRGPAATWRSATDDVRRVAAKYLVDTNLDAGDLAAAPAAAQGRARGRREARHEVAERLGRASAMHSGRRRRRASSVVGLFGLRLLPRPAAPAATRPRRSRRPATRRWSRSSTSRCRSLRLHQRTWPRCRSAPDGDADLLEGPHRPDQGAAAAGAGRAAPAPGRSLAAQERPRGGAAWRATICPSSASASRSRPAATTRRRARRWAWPTSRRHAAQGDQVAHRRSDRGRDRLRGRPARRPQASGESSAAGCSALSKDAHLCIDLLSDILLRPSFPEIGDGRGARPDAGRAGRRATTTRTSWRASTSTTCCSARRTPTAGC